MTAGPESRAARGAGKGRTRAPAAGDRAPGQEQGSEDEEREGADAAPAGQERHAPSEARRALRRRRWEGLSGRDVSRHAPRPARPARQTSELEPVVGGRDAQGTLTPGQLLEPLGLAPDRRRLLVVVGRLVMEEAQVRTPAIWHSSAPTTLLGGPSPP